MYEYRMDFQNNYFGWNYPYRRVILPKILLMALTLVLGSERSAGSYYSTTGAYPRKGDFGSGPLPLKFKL